MQLSLTIVGGARETRQCRRGCGKTVCNRGSNRAPARGPSTSPLDRPPRSSAAQCAFMKTSTLVIILGGLLSMTTVKWSQLWDRRTLGQINQDIRAGKQRASRYAKVVAPVALILMIAGIYMALSGE